MKHPKLSSILTIIFLVTFTIYSYANNSDFILIEKEVQSGIHKKTKYGLAKKNKVNPVLRGLSFSSASTQVEIIPPIYDEIEVLFGDFWGVAKDKKMGLVDKDGKIVFEVEYDAIDELGENLFVLLKNNKTGVAKRDGEILLDTHSPYLPEFCGEFLVVNSYFEDATGRSTLLNKKGDFIVDVRHKFIRGGICGINHLGDSFYNFFKGSWGLTDDLGNIIIEPDESNYHCIIPADLRAYSEHIPKKYILKSFILEKPTQNLAAKDIPRTVKRHNVDAISYIGNDLFLYFKDKKFGIINRKRKTIEPFKYDKMSIVDGTNLLLENSKNKEEHFKIKTSEVVSLRYILKYVEI